MVIGGVSLAGGAGSLLGTFAGVLIIGVFYNIMNLLSVNAYLQIVLKGRRADCRRLILREKESVR